MGLADLHTHTNLSDGMMDVPSLLEHVERHTEIDVLAVTDHDDITGGLLAREIAAKEGYRFEVIVGEEITTREGHLVALFLEERVPPLQSLEATLLAVHDQGGLAIVPHPMSWLTFSIGRRSIERITASGVPGVHFDGIETGNPTIAARLTRARVVQLNEESLHLPNIGASDAHFLPAVASGFTSFSGRTAEDLRWAVLAGDTEAVATEMELRRIGYGQIAMQQVQSLVIHPARSVGRPLLRFMRRGAS